MAFSVTVLGSSSTFATAERAASGYLVEIDDYKLWLDAGPGTWRNLLTLCDYWELDGVVLSHLHPDHTTDVFQAFHAWVYGSRGPLSPIPLWAPGETITRLEAFCPDLSDGFDLHQVSAGDRIEIGPGTARFVTMAHPPVTLGVRLDARGGVLAYSADSGLDADFATLASDAGVFICEATFQDDHEEWKGHMRAGEAGAVARSCRVGRLVLTHLPHDADLDVSLRQAKDAAGDVDVMLAEDLKRIEVSS